MTAVTAIGRSAAYPCRHGREEWFAPQSDQDNAMKDNAMDEMRELTMDELDAVSGGFMRIIKEFLKKWAPQYDGPGPQNDPAAQFQQIMQDLTRHGA